MRGDAVAGVKKKEVYGNVRIVSMKISDEVKKRKEEINGRVGEG